MSAKNLSEFMTESEENKKDVSISLPKEQWKIVLKALLHAENNDENFNPEFYFAVSREIKKQLK